MDAVLAKIAEIDALVGGRAVETSDLTVLGSPNFASAFDLDTAALAAAGYANVVFGATEVSGSALSTYFATPVEVNGESLPKWSTLSGYYNTANGRHLQLHCNFPHHHEGVVQYLGCEDSRQAVQEAILDHDPIELETALIDAGMIAAHVRTLAEWQTHPHAVATTHLPLVSIERIGDGDPRIGEAQTRVLDCSRVLAGPVAGQLFAAFGADVLRIDAPHLPSVPICVITTGSGKRNASLDLRSPADAEQMRRLLSSADVWIDAYRPGALGGHGFDADSIPEGCVMVQLSAFDWEGPWAGRRGFDSIVQSTTGIVDAGTRAANASAPTPLPVQALDYMTGLLAAGAAEKARQRQRREGGTWRVRVSLLRTRNWLTSLGGPREFVPATVEPDPQHLVSMESAFGTVQFAKPTGGTPSRPPQPLRSAAATWVE